MRGGSNVKKSVLSDHGAFVKKYIIRLPLTSGRASRGSKESQSDDWEGVLIESQNVDYLCREQFIR